MQIKQISNAVTPGTTAITIFGLGDDNRVYLWSYALGAWVPNWAQEKPAAPVVGKVKPAAKKKAAQKKAKK